MFPLALAPLPKHCADWDPPWCLLSNYGDRPACNADGVLVAAEFALVKSYQPSQDHGRPAASELSYYEQGKDSLILPFCVPGRHNHAPPPSPPRPWLVENLSSGECFMAVFRFGNFASPRCDQIDFSFARLFRRSRFLNSWWRTGTKDFSRSAKPCLPRCS